jgi:hypothetical protein
MSDKERKKINEKTRKQQETAARAKADALRDDDNVFDVSFEQQGAGGEAADSVVSATDIKVVLLQLTPPTTHVHGVWVPCMVCQQQGGQIHHLCPSGCSRGMSRKSTCVTISLQKRYVQNADRAMTTHVAPQS